MTMVGVEGISSLPGAQRAGVDWVVDPRPGLALRPRDLYRAMRLTREQRLGALVMPVAN